MLRNALGEIGPGQLYLLVTHSPHLVKRVASLKVS